MDFFSFTKKYTLIYEKVVAENPVAAHDFMLRAINYYLVQDLESSVADLDCAIAADSTSWEYYFVRSFVRYKLLEAEMIDAVDKTAANLDYRLVKSDLDNVVALCPDFVYAYFNRGNVFAKLNDYKSAIVDYSRVIESNDRFAEAYFNRGLARLYIGNVEQGVVDLSKAGELGLFQAYNVIKRFMYSGNRTAGAN